MEIISKENKFPIDVVWLLTDWANYLKCYKIWKLAIKWKMEMKKNGQKIFCEKMGGRGKSLVPSGGHGNEVGEMKNEAVKWE